MATMINARHPPEGPRQPQIINGEQAASHALDHWAKQERRQYRKQLELEERKQPSFFKTHNLPRPTVRKSFTNWLQCVKTAGAKSGRVTERSRTAAKRKLERIYKSEYVSVEKTAMAEARGSTGGYLTPVDYTLALMEVIAEESYIYPRATVLPMTTASLIAPRVDVETLQTTGTSALVGGIKFVWGFEDAVIETEPQFRAVELTAYDLLGFSVTSNQFLMDIGPMGERALFNLLGRAAAWYMEYAFLQGSGSALLMPLGIVNAPASIIVQRGTVGNIAVGDIAKMASKLLPFSWKHAMWMASPTCLQQIVQLTNYFVNDGSSSDGSCGNLLTRPLFVTEKLAALGAQGDLILFDPRLYVIGQRMDIAIDVSEHDAFRNFQTTFRVWLRCDGKPWVSNYITLADGITQVSPFVLLR